MSGATSVAVACGGLAGEAICAAVRNDRRFRLQPAAPILDTSEVVGPRSRPDVVVTDRPSDWRPGVMPRSARVVVVTNSRNPAHTMDLLRRGVRGVVSADCSTAAVIEAVAGVAATDQLWVTPELSSEILADCAKRDARRTVARHKLGGLTDSELRVARLLGDGLTNAEIAGALHLAECTAKEYAARVLRRLDMSRVQAAALVAMADLHDGLAYSDVMGLTTRQARAGRLRFDGG